MGNNNDGVVAFGYELALKQYPRLDAMYRIKNLTPEELIGQNIMTTDKNGMLGGWGEGRRLTIIGYNTTSCKEAFFDLVGENCKSYAVEAKRLYLAAVLEEDYIEL